MSRLLAVALSFLLVPAWGQETLQQQAQRVEAALNRLTQEQQAVYQQFQMIQELRRSEERLVLQRLPLSGTSSAIRNYDEVQREDEARAQRRNDLKAESDRLYGRYRELEEQKRPLLETLSALAQQRAAGAPTVAAPDVPAAPAPVR